MKDIYENHLMKWLMNKNKTAERAYSIIGTCGGLSLFAIVLFSIILDHLTLSGWAGDAVRIFILILALLVLAAGTYCNYAAHLLWMYFLLFGPVNLIMGLYIDMDAGFRIFLSVAGIIMTASGIILLPILNRRRKAVAKQISDWMSNYNERILEKVTRPETEEKSPSPKPDESNAAMLARLITRVRLFEEAAKKNSTEEYREKWKDAKKELAATLLDLDTLYVLILHGTSDPYMGIDGRMELFSSEAIAENAIRLLSANINVSTELKPLTGSDAAEQFFLSSAHNGYGYLRLDNGCKYSCELEVQDFVSYRCENIVDEKNRNLRMLFHRTKQYTLQLADQPDKRASHYLGIYETLMTMQANAYRDLGQGLVYALANPMPEDKPYATAAAQETLRKWLPGSGFEEQTRMDAPDESITLSLYYVNRPGQVGIKENGCVCLFTDYAQAKQGQAMFRKGNMDNSIVIMTYDEILPHAQQCAGIVLDMATLNHIIPKGEYGKIELYRKFDAPILFNLKQSEEAKTSTPQPRLKHTEKAGPWRKYDYQWPHGYGYSYMLKSLQWVMDHEMPAMTLNTAHIIGAPEQERIEEYRTSGDLLATVGQETGVLSIGGNSPTTGCLTKIYWYNQTNLIRIFTLGDADQKKIDALVCRLFTETTKENKAQA